MSTPSLTPHREWLLNRNEVILHAARDRCPQRTIARAFDLSPAAVAKVLKKFGAMHARSKSSPTR